MKHVIENKRRKQLEIYHLGRDALMKTKNLNEEKVEALNRFAHPLDENEPAEGDEVKLLVRPGKKDNGAPFVANLPNGKVCIFDNGDPNTFSLQPGLLVEAYVYRDFPKYAVVRYLKTIKDYRGQVYEEPYFPRLAKIEEEETGNVVEVPVQKRVEPVVSKREAPPVRSVELKVPFVVYEFLGLMERGHITTVELTNALEKANTARNNAVQAAIRLLDALEEVNLIRKATEEEERVIPRVKFARSYYVWNALPFPGRAGNKWKLEME